MKHDSDVNPLQKGNLLNAKLVISYDYDHHRINTVDQQIDRT